MLKQFVNQLQLMKDAKPAQEPIPLEVRPLRPRGTLELLDLFSYFMDRKFVVPGTNFRFGLNSLFLFLPVVGDILPGLISLGILTLGLSSYKVPRIVAARMVLNSLLDTAVSAVPVVGNVWDVLYKADTRNVRLLREYVAPEGKPRPLWHHWAFVGGAFAALVVVVALVVLGLISLLQMLVQGVTPRSQNT